jgi:lysine-N-methylase
MSKNITLNVFSPKYLEDFRCAGPDCVDTCCYGWRILIDKKSYYKLKNIPFPKLKETINSSVVRNQESKSSGDFAVIKINELKYCGLLQENSLCGLHAHLGEDYLPDVCASYPKSTTQIRVHQNTVNQQFATSSCPEIAKLIIKRKDSMEIVEASVNIRPSTSFIHSDAESLSRLNLSSFYAQILLHATSDALWQRIMLLNLFSNDFEQLTSSDSVDDLIERYLSFVGSSSIQQAFSEYRWDSSLTSSIAGGLFSIRSLLGTSSRHYYQLLSQIEQWIIKKSLGEVSSDDSSPDRLLTFEDFAGAAEHIMMANEQYWLPWIQKNSEAFARILANEVLRVLLPLDHQNTIKGTLQMTMHYVLLRFLVTIKAAAQEKPIDDDMFLSVVHPYFREIIHSVTFLEKMTEVLESTGLAKLSRLAMILPDK